MCYYKHVFFLSHRISSFFLFLTFCDATNIRLLCNVDLRSSYSSSAHVRVFLTVERREWKWEISRGSVGGVAPAVDTTREIEMVRACFDEKPRRQRDWQRVARKTDGLYEVCAMRTRKWPISRGRKTRWRPDHVHSQRYRRSFERPLFGHEPTYASSHLLKRSCPRLPSLLQRFQYEIRSWNVFYFHNAGHHNTGHARLAKYVGYCVLGLQANGNKNKSYKIRM